MRMDGRKVIVTGGAQGIGLGIATRLAQEGASVMIGDLNSEGAEAAAANLRDSGLDVAAHPVDVSRRDSTQELVAAAVERFGRLDVMFNNAGFNKPEPFLQITEEVLRHLVTRDDRPARPGRRDGLDADGDEDVDDADLPSAEDEDDDVDDRAERIDESETEAAPAAID